jgi:hypothetical protein
VALKARNRLSILETGEGSLAFLPPSHKFFFEREVESNLGYVYYRKDNENSVAVGVRQADREEGFKAFGVSDRERNQRVNQSRRDEDNFALYNAPPGTMQCMSSADSRATQQAIMRFTDDDVYKAMPGFKVLVSHFHFISTGSSATPARPMCSHHGCPCFALWGSTPRCSRTSTAMPTRPTPALRA